MTNRFAVFAAAAVMLAGSGPLAGQEGLQPLPIGSSAPMTDVRMLNVDGNEVSIADVAGEHGTLVMFSCNHCPWVKAWEPRIAAIGNEFSRRGVGVIAVNSNDPLAYPEDAFEVMVERAAERGFEFAYVVDATSEVARAYGATKTPEAFLFDAEMELVYYGTIDDNAQHPDEVQKTFLADALEALVAGTEIPVAETKALGCSIKYRDE